MGDIEAPDKAGDDVGGPTAPARGADATDGVEHRGAGGPARSLASRLRAHPLLVVAGGAALIAIGQAIWIWTHRNLGAFDPDESGYIAAAMRMHRSIDLLRPWNLVITVGGTGNGITTPLLSVPFLLAGPRDPRAAMLVQPFLMVVTSVAVGGITRKLAGPWAAIAAGLLFAVLPTTILATQSYWYGLSAATFMALGMWALVTSDRGENRRIWWFGVAIGLMFLSRTMTLGYAPAVAVAGLVVTGWDPRRLLRLAGAGALSILVAGPWYFHNRQSIFEYLFSYGYGERAGRFGQGDVFERAGMRVDRIEQAFGVSKSLLGVTVTQVLCAAALISVLSIAWRRWRTRGVGPSRQPDALRAATAVAAAFVVGMAALVSTSNNGVWFEYPLVVLAVPLVVALIALGPRWVRVLTTVVVTALSVQLLAQLWWIVPFEAPAPTSHYEYGFAEYDERFAPDRRDEHAEAAGDWWDATTSVLESMREQAPGRGAAAFTVSGNMQMFNANTLALAGELETWPPYMTIPDTAAGEDERAAALTPTDFFEGEYVERILVIALHDQTLFTPDTEVEAFAEEAQDAGWEVVDQVDLPDGGMVQILRSGDDG